MSNNRITYATAQLSIKDNRADATTRIMVSERKKTYPPLRLLASGISASSTVIWLDESVTGFWPATAQFRVKTGSAVTEYIRYASLLDGSGLAGCTRGTGGTTAGVHSVGNTAQLLGWEVPLGVQTVSIGTAFNTEDVFTIGQLDAYENVEGIPDIEVTIERVFDGTKPLFLMVTDPDYTALKGRTANYKCDIAVSVYPDTQDSAYGTPDSTVLASGCYISSWTATLPTDGNFTESVTLVGNDKQWGYGVTPAAEGIPSGFFIKSDEVDATVIGSGVQRSENFNRTASTLPGEIQSTDHIQSIEVSVDLTREEIYRLGQKTPYYRAVDWPVTVTTTFEVITDAGDKVDAIGHTGQANLVNRTIILKTDEGLTINLGTKNKLANVSFEGFDAGGGNGTCTFEYTNSNSLTVTHDAFPDVYDTNI